MDILNFLFIICFRIGSRTENLYKSFFRRAWCSGQSGYYVDIFKYLWFNKYKNKGNRGW